MTADGPGSGAADFDPVSAGYDAARPSYPRVSVEWLVGDAAVVADVGAGTGKFTGALQRPGRRVIAVEPSTGMLAELRRELPHVESLQGTGERMPLPEASVDVVTFAQAWHWVDSDAGSAEAARVLREGGTLGLVWNLRDERVDWVRALGTAMRADGDHYRGEVEDPLVGHEFEGPERQYVEWVRPCTRDEIVDDVRSRSYFALLPPDEQQQVLAAVRRVLDAPGLSSEDGEVELPYVTAAFRYARRRTRPAEEHG